ncbi:MAG: hypothetical protein DMF86_12875 [Acidobacteria bacterium]|nr:MAG: hypothetical protein DMF86_12875 [Acidobacteriota bacterium]
MTMTVENNGRERKSAVIVAHPGHELMIYHWIERHRPLYCCLTDGSGGRAVSRVASTTRLLEGAGAVRGPICGRYSDKQIYRLLLDKQVHAFVGLMSELAEALSAAGVECVAGDATEGFNPVHDVCRILIDGAVAMVRRQTRRQLRNYEFVLDSAPGGAAASPTDGAEVLRLDGAALERKIAAALGYPEMRAEVEAAVARFGRQAFAVEVLKPAGVTSPGARFEHEPPTYERHGQMRVNEGLYSEIITYGDHVRPVLRAVEDAAR